VLIGYTCGVGEAVDVGDDIEESGVAGKFKGSRVNGGSGREGGEVQGPETVPGCLFEVGAGNWEKNYAGPRRRVFGPKAEISVQRG
jgi:hypothetical protein